MMADNGFRRDQQAGAYLPHVGPINEYVDQLRSRGWGSVPYVAPFHGGVEASVLSVLSDPGPKTQDDVGSGMLCIENDDPTAANQCRHFASASVAASDVTPWNSYPWFIDRTPRARERETGVETLVAMIDLMPKLRVLFLQGRPAQDVWARTRRRHPRLQDARGFAVVETWHPSARGTLARTSEATQARKREQAEAYRRVGLIVRGGRP